MRDLKNTKTLCVCAHACRKIEKLALHSEEQLPSTRDQLSEPCPAAHEGWLVSLDSPEYRVSALQGWQERRALGAYFEKQVTRVLEVSGCWDVHMCSVGEELGPLSLLPGFTLHPVLFALSLDTRHPRCRLSLHGYLGHLSRAQRLPGG